MLGRNLVGVGKIPVYESFQVVPVNFFILSRLVNEDTLVFPALLRKLFPHSPEDYNTEQREVIVRCY